MFDISFIELLVVFVVALLVLGPEKLPGAVRTGALWIGRAKRSFGKVKAEIEQQLNADDIRRQLHNESILADIEKARKSADKLVQDTRKELDKTHENLNKSVSSALAAPAAAPVAVVTNSAVEGVPTFQTTTDSVRQTESDAAGSEMSTQAPSLSESTTLETSVSETSGSETSVSETSGSDTSIANTLADNNLAAGAKTTHVTAEKKPVQDFYNNPPSGLVSMQNGKLTAAVIPSQSVERPENQKD